MKKNVYSKNPEDYIDVSAVYSNQNWADEKAVYSYYSSIGIDFIDEKPNIEYATLVQYIMANVCVVRNEEGIMYIYNFKRGVYEVCDAYNLSSVVRFILNQGNISLFDKRKFNEIEAQIKSYTIHIIKAFDTGKYYTFINQSYDVESFKVTPFSPKHFTLLKMDYKCDPSCIDHPVFDKFLDDFTCGNDELKILIQEIAGYLFWPCNVAQRSFIMCGPARSGKSTMAKLLSMLLGGIENGAVISTSLNCLASCFGLEGIEQAKAIITTESEKDEYVKTSIYKAIVSGDSVSLNEKHRKRKTVAPKCKILSFTNHLPRFSEADPSLERRILIFPCKADIKKEDIDTDLLNKLKMELPAIFNWAMEGLKRLKQNKWIFSETDDTKGLVTNYITSSDSLYKFIMEYIVADINAPFLRFSEIQLKYEIWASNNGYDVNTAKFGQLLVEHLDSLKISYTASRQKGYDGVKGITLKQ